MYTVMDTSLWDIDLICMSWNFCETLLIDLKLNSPTLNIVTKIQNSSKNGIIQYCFWQVRHLTTCHFLQITLYGWTKVKCDKHLDNHLQESQNHKMKYKIDIARYILKIQINCLWIYLINILWTKTIYTFTTSMNQTIKVWSW